MPSSWQYRAEGVNFNEGNLLFLTASHSLECLLHTVVFVNAFAALSAVDEINSPSIYSCSTRNWPPKVHKTGVLFSEWVVTYARGSVTYCACVKGRGTTCEP